MFSRTSWKTSRFSKKEKYNNHIQQWREIYKVLFFCFSVEYRSWAWIVDHYLPKVWLTIVIFPLFPHLPAMNTKSKHDLNRTSLEFGRLCFWGYFVNVLYMKFHTLLKWSKQSSMYGFCVENILIIQHLMEQGLSKMATWVWRDLDGSWVVPIVCF